MKIGIVNDMPIAVQALRRVLALRPQYQVVWVAKDGQEAIELCAWQTPDLVLMDLLMPNMGGVEATRQIMARTPCAILVVTVDVGVHASKVYEAMGWGAIDAVDTPTLEQGDAHKGGMPLLAKIEAIRSLIDDGQDKPRNAVRTPSQTDVADRLVAIGASAGGPAALATVLGKLPVDFPAAIVVIQHIDQAFAAGMIQWLDQQCALPVGLAQEGDRPLAATVLVAGSGSHLRLKSGETLGYTTQPLENSYQPSIDVFFHSVVELWRGRAVGVLLTGMGSDGAQGLKAMRNRGFHTIAQDRISSAVYGMPKAAAAMGAADDILPVELIASRLTGAFT